MTRYLWPPTYPSMSSFSCHFEYCRNFSGKECPRFSFGLISGLRKTMELPKEPIKKPSVVSGQAWLRCNRQWVSTRILTTVCLSFSHGLLSPKHLSFCIKEIFTFPTGTLFTKSILPILVNDEVLRTCSEDSWRRESKKRNLVYVLNWKDPRKYLGCRT